MGYLLQTFAVGKPSLTTWATMDTKQPMKSLVDVFNETGEPVALATILTMVKKLDQN
jgi:hypothetical protein